MEIKSLTSQEVPEPLPCGGYHRGRRRQYELKRLAPDRVQRSLSRAAARAEGWPLLMVSTCPGEKLPDFLETIYNGKEADWSLFEAWSRGLVEDGRLECFVHLKDDPLNCRQVLISLSRITSIHVEYCEKAA